MTNYLFIQTNAILFRNLKKIYQHTYNFGANTSEVAKFVGDKINVSPYIVDNTIGVQRRPCWSGLKWHWCGYWWQKKIKIHLKMNYEAPGLRGFTAAPYQSSNGVQRVYDDYKGTRRKLHNAFRLTGQMARRIRCQRICKTQNASDSLKGLNKASKAIINNERMSGEQRGNN